MKVLYIIIVIIIISFIWFVYTKYRYKHIPDNFDNIQNNIQNNFNNNTISNNILNSLPRSYTFESPNNKVGPSISKYYNYPYVNLASFV